MEDKAPVITRERWKRDSSPRNSTPADVPWLFAPGDTTSVFRFTVFLESEDKPVVIYQPFVIRMSTKAQLKMFGTR